MTINETRRAHAVGVYLGWRGSLTADRVSAILEADERLRLARPSLFTSSQPTGDAMNEKQEDGKQDEEPKLPGGIKYEDVGTDDNRMRYVTRTGFCIPLLTQSELRAIADHMDRCERQEKRKREAAEVTDKMITAAMVSQFGTVPISPKDNEILREQIRRTIQAALAAQKAAT